MFINNILGSSISSVVKESSQSDFNIDEKNLSIMNKKRLLWANCKLDDNTIVQLSVDSTRFSIGVKNNQITLSYSKLSYPIIMLGAQVGQVITTFNRQFQLALMTGTNGNKTLWFDVPAD